MVKPSKKASPSVITACRSLVRYAVWNDACGALAWALDGPSARSRLKLAYSPNERTQHKAERARQENPQQRPQARLVSEYQRAEETDHQADSANQDPGAPTRADASAAFHPIAGNS